MGYRVLQVGCDPKADSTKLLTGLKESKTVLNLMKDGSVDIAEAVFDTGRGIFCVECGGPKPGTGCAGRGIIAAFDELESQNVIEVYKPDIIIYDVLGDVVCGGFAMPIRNGYARNVFVVTSGELMSLYAANNIKQAVDGFSEDGYAEFSGLIQNSRNIEDENNIVDSAAKEMGAEVIFRLPRDGIVQKSEDVCQTVVRFSPESDMAKHYRNLAKKILSLSEDSEGGMKFERN